MGAMVISLGGRVWKPCSPNSPLFPDGLSRCHDDQIDAVCNVAANLELVSRRAPVRRAVRLYPAESARRPLTPPKSRDQELYDRRRQFRD
jgi:hypothetical protein